MDEAECYVEPATLTTGQRLAEPVVEPGEFQLIDDPLHPRWYLGGRHSVHLGLDFQLLAHQAVGIRPARSEADGLWDVADALAHVARVAAEVGAADNGGAGGRL